nr:hypothetical protein [uncultured Campylobacter sp.]
MKIGKSHVFVLVLALIIIYAAFVSGSGGYCNAREFFSGRHDEEDDACIAKLIKRADDGNIFAQSRLSYPSEAYIRRVCEKGVENLGERERYYFQNSRGDHCKKLGFKTPKSKGGEANTTSGEANATDGERNLTREGANTIHDEAGAIKGDVNSTGGLNAGQ